MKSFLQFVLRYKKTAALALCALVAATFLLLRPHPHVASANPYVINPILAVEFLQAANPSSLFFTLSAHDYLAANKPEWISAHNTRQDLLDFYHAGQDASRWRQLDHLLHFDAVLLTGDPSEYNPLLDHLMVSKDWTLVYLDHTSIIFKRSPATQWIPEDLGAVRQKFADYPPVDRASFLTQLASKLLAIRKNDLAKQQLDESLALDHNSPETWTQMALYELQGGRLNDALEDTGRALKLDKEYYYALTTRARVLYTMQHFDEAFQVSQRLVETQKDSPSYPNVLYFHAIIAHKANRFTDEIATLNNLIAIISAQNQPVSFYLVMLGQAYEMDGDAKPALEEFQKALDEGTLSEQQVAAVQMTIQSIKKQTSPGP